ncbi:MAG TPA: hypothetical protein VGD17_16505 [Chitinophagaceae bacterium]
MKNAIKHFGTLAVILSLVLASSTASIANNDKIKDSSPIEFRFIGKIEQQPVYQLNIHNADGDEFTVSFTDRSGTVLYSGVTKSEVLTQRFLINAEEVGDEVLTVSIVSRKSGKSYIYTIKRSQSIVEENIVQRVK